MTMLGGQGRQALPAVSPQPAPVRPQSAAPETTLNLSFFSVIAHQDELVPGLTALCAGYELEHWRAKEFARHLMDWLIDFCLSYSELQSFNPLNAARFIRQAASRIYQTKKFENRGEFGELMLHAILRQIYSTVPAVSKIYYKDSANDTVKGFDAVHVVEESDSLELWLGEVKFYDNINRAISDVIAEIDAHMQRDYLRGEFLAIQNKVDDNWPHSNRLKKLLHENTSLDTIFDSVCLPILLTYDSQVLAQHTRYSEKYQTEIQEEVRRHYSRFASKKLPNRVRVHLFLVPLNTKAILLRELDERLRTWQTL